MNKYAILGIALVVLIAASAAWSALKPDTGNVIGPTGDVKRITITIRKEAWRFDPENINVIQGDKVLLTVVNEDEFDHGIAIDAYGVSQRVPAKSQITAEFIASRAGAFPFYCSVPCGEGEVDGVKRGHFDQVGELTVERLVRPAD